MPEGGECCSQGREGQNYRHLHLILGTTEGDDFRLLWFPARGSSVPSQMPSLSTSVTLCRSISLTLHDSSFEAPFVCLSFLVFSLTWHSPTFCHQSSYFSPSSSKSIPYLIYADDCCRVVYTLPIAEGLILILKATLPQCNPEKQETHVVQSRRDC